MLENKKTIEAFNLAIGARLKDFIRKSSMSQKEFCDKINFNPSSLSLVINGKGGMSNDLIYKLYSEFKIDFNWLIGGTNNESVESREGKSSFIDTAMNHYEREIELLKEQLKLKDEIIFLLKNQRP